MNVHNIYHYLFSIQPTYLDYNPGIQVTSDNSIIFALGWKDSNSIMFEFVYNSKFNSYDEEVLVGTRKDNKLSAFTTTLSEVNNILLEFF